MRQYLHRLRGAAPIALLLLVPILCWGHPQGQVQVTHKTPTPTHTPTPTPTSTATAKIKPVLKTTHAPTHTAKLASVTSAPAPTTTTTTTTPKSSPKPKPKTTTTAAPVKQLPIPERFVYDFDRSKIEPASHWVDSAQASLNKKLKIELEKSKAKNIILLLGDGMSLATITATRIYKGQVNLQGYGEESNLHMDSFPFGGTSKTYCADFQTADSACSATAYLAGIKANVKTIGVTTDVQLDNCTQQMNKANHVSNILAWAQAAGKATGIITSTRVTHASPAGTYAHIANRDWENDKKVRESGYDPDYCDDIAEQLILNEPGRNINVILGGGRTHFLPEHMLDIETKNPGARNDSKNLIREWLDDKESLNRSAAYITTREQLLTLDTTKHDYLLGLFADNHITYEDEHDDNDDPTVAHMAQVAFDILKRNPNGFFMFIEGGRIDHAHHDNFGQRALAETLAFDDAVELMDRLTFDNETLIVVTADHAHSFTMAGYAWRGTPIVGFANGGKDAETADGLPYTTMSYINGKLGARQAQKSGDRCMRANIVKDIVINITYNNYAHVPMKESSTHGGEDVLILAKGPWAHLFGGVNEQSFIPHAMSYAACINPHGQNSCDQPSVTTTTPAPITCTTPTSATASLPVWTLSTLFVHIVMIILNHVHAARM